MSENLNRFKKLCKKYNLNTHKKQVVLRDLFLGIFIHSTWKDEDEVWERAEVRLAEYIKVTHNAKNSTDDTE